MSELLGERGGGMLCKPYILDLSKQVKVTEIKDNKPEGLKGRRSVALPPLYKDEARGLEEGACLLTAIAPCPYSGEIKQGCWIWQVRSTWKYVLPARVPPVGYTPPFLRNTINNECFNTKLNTFVHEIFLFLLNSNPCKKL